MKKYIILFLFIISGFMAKASVNSDLISQANDAYTQNKFNQAIELYQKVVTSGFESASLYYNLGDAYFKTKNYASALLYFEKAKKLDPANEKIAFNIQVCNARIIDKIEELPQPFYIQWLADFRFLFSIDVWAVISVVMLFLFFLLMAVYLMANAIRTRKLSFWAGLVFLLVALVSCVNAYSQYRGIHNSNEGIVFEPTVNVKSSPDAASQDLFVIHEGTKVTITDKVNTWIEVRIANGSDGWVPETVVERI
ncbi:MAG: tetratricopeptide repeat protein [Bacteroidota bacterium]